MRRLITVGAVIALLVLAAAPFASAGTTVTTKHVDGSVKVIEPGGWEWLARFEVRTNAAGDVVWYGWFELDGLTPGLTGNQGQIHVYDVRSVTYSRTATGQGAVLHMDEYRMIPKDPEVQVDYDVFDGSPNGSLDSLLSAIGWVRESGNISIYATSGQNTQ